MRYWPSPGSVAALMEMGFKPKMQTMKNTKTHSAISDLSLSALQTHFTVASQKPPRKKNNQRLDLYGFLLIFLTVYSDRILLKFLVFNYAQAKAGRHDLTEKSKATEKLIISLICLMFSFGLDIFYSPILASRKI